MNPADLHAHPNALAADYSRFRVSERLLLTGHSHQAWPDRGFEGQVRAWEDAAAHVDDKWTRAFEEADRVRSGFAWLLDDAPDRIALAANTHEFVIRLLSALPLVDRPRIVTTDGEFHTLRRQLDRLAEEGVEIVRVPARPTGEIAARLIDALDDHTAAVMASAVLFENARIVPDLGAVCDRAERVGALCLVDAYHALCAIPFALSTLGLERAYVVGGGYKYCQLGEGNAFLRFPDGCDLRPVVTGWYSEFAALTTTTGDGRVAYGTGPARFAGATYDPTSHYRAAEVFTFFDERGLTPAVLRDVSQHQIAWLADAFDRLDIAPELIARDRSVPLEDIGGFLALETPYAAEFQRALLDRGITTDHRGARLRLGPAPYLSDHQLALAIDGLAEVALEMRR